MAVRVDLSRSIGTGHLLRCRPLVDRLKARGAEPVWIVRKTDVDPQPFLGSRDKIETFFEEDRFSDIESSHWFQNYSWQKDAEETWKSLEKHQCSVVLVDHYALDSRWVSFLRKKNPQLRIVFVDDLANRSLNSDVVIDPNLRFGGYGVYDSLIKHGTRVFGGPLFNPLICKQDLLQARKKRMSSSFRTPKKVLLFFGGADLMNATRSVLRALAREKWESVSFTVVAGKANGRKSELQSLAQATPGFSYFEHVDNWAEFMSDFDIAIGAAGTSAWERAFIGLPAINFAISDNQVLVGEESHKAGIAFYLGPFSENKVAAAVSKLKEWLSDSKTLFSYKEKGLQLWPLESEGLDEPLLQVFLQDKKIQFSPAKEEHCKMLFDWRNDPVTRKGSVQKDEVSYETHVEWYKNSLKNPNRKIFFGKIGPSFIGMVRFDLGDRGWELSWNVAPMWRGQGIGKEIVKQATGLVNHNLWAKILLDNLSSMRVAEYAGFEKIEQNESLSYWEKKQKEIE